MTKAITPYIASLWKQEEPSTAFTKLSMQYSSAFPLRAAIQGIPVLGGSLDTILAGLGSKWQTERLESYVKMLEERLKKLEAIRGEIKIEPSEELYDFIMQTIDFAIRTRSKEKRRLFANIVTNQVINNGNWDEAEAASRLLNDLSELHIQVLATALGPNMKAQKAEGARLITFTNHYKDEEALDIRELFSDVSVMALRMTCSELLSKGLLHDQGVGRGGIGSMEYFEPTDLTEWFVNWIREP
jgi:hypothetical protein